VCLVPRALAILASRAPKPLACTTGWRPVGPGRAALSEARDVGLAPSQDVAIDLCYERGSRLAIHKELEP